MVKKIILGLMSLTFLSYSTLAHADEIVVSGNGDGSNNSVNISSSNNNQSSQTNNATVDNNVSQNANTGDNSASQNNGNASVTTGDANSTSNIQNNDINQSYIDNQNCCSNNATNAQISGNGSYSSNSIGYNNGSNTSVSINNNANINNNVYGNVNTGYNSADYNNGNVWISTGDISAKDTIKNHSINMYIVKAPGGNGQSAYLKISGNGEESENSILMDNNNDISVNILNSATIINNSHWDLNTGGNHANGNDGDIAITTGDIAFDTFIENGPINVGYVDIACCNQKENNNPPPGNNPPPSNTSSGSSNNSSSNSVASAPGGPVLPVTGDYTMLLFLIGNILMFFLGGYLRLRSGRSPNFAFFR